MMRLTTSMTIPKGAARVADDPGFGSTFFEPLWYAAYTKANHEKRVAQQLEQRSVEHFLPLYESMRRWKDRRMLASDAPVPRLCFRESWRCATAYSSCKFPA